MDIQEIAIRKPLAFVCVYLVLYKKDSVLLSLRDNTGFKDGYYGLVSGHVEEGESASTSLAREAFEEAGITIHPSDLHLLHILHNRSNRVNIDIFFGCSNWTGELENKEPEKCKELDYFPLKNLPENTIPYIRKVLERIDNRESYSEYGWSNGKYFQEDHSL